MKLKAYLEALKSCPDRLVERGEFGAGDLTHLPMLTRDFGVYDNYDIFLKAKLEQVARELTKRGFSYMAPERYLKTSDVALRLDSPPGYLHNLKYLSQAQKRKVKPYPTEVIVSPTMPRGLGKDQDELVQVVRNLANAIIRIGDWVIKDKIPAGFLWFYSSPSRVAFYP